MQAAALKSLIKPFRTIKNATLQTDTKTSIFKIIDRLFTVAKMLLKYIRIKLVLTVFISITARLRADLT